MISLFGTGGAPLVYGKVAIITGASRGIGAGIARAFAADGCYVAGIGRNVEALNAVAGDIESKGGTCIPIIADVTEPHQVKNAIEQVLEKFCKIDILVNNAGIALYKPCLEMSVSEWQQVIDVNLRGVFICTRALLPHMVERGVGHIIFISSENLVWWATGSLTKVVVRRHTEMVYYK